MPETPGPSAVEPQRAVRLVVPRKRRLIPLSALRNADAREKAERELQHEELLEKLLCAIRVRDGFTWSWGAGAEYLYRALIQALGFGMQEEEVLIKLAKPKPGRKQERELAKRIWELTAEGKTARQIKRIFEAEGQHFSLEKIESYRKSRRKRLPAY